MEGASDGRPKKYSAVAEAVVVAHLQQRVVRVAVAELAQPRGAGGPGCARSTSCASPLTLRRAAPRARLAAHDLHGLGWQRASGAEPCFVMPAGIAVRAALPPLPPQAAVTGRRGQPPRGRGQGAPGAAGGAGGPRGRASRPSSHLHPDGCEAESDAGQRTRSCARPSSPLPRPLPALTFPALKRLRAAAGAGRCPSRRR